MFEYILNRLKEPSSWRGIIALITAMGVQLAPDQVDAIVSLGLAVIGVINVFVKEKAKPEAKPDA